MPARKKSAAQRAETELRRIAMKYPEAVEDHPWGHSAFKVRKKAFVFMGLSDDGLSLSMKLPQSNSAALMLPFAEPTGYGLGKSGWVSASFGLDDDAPVELLSEWIEESYRAIAPKTLSRQLDGDAPPPAVKKRQASKATKTKAAKKSPARPARARKD